MTDGTVPGPDGRPRCPWAVSPADYVAYHDEEWGRPVRDDRGLFERLTLEAFQSGLSWITILRKRPAFRAAFGDFDPRVIAAYDDHDVERLLQDTGIVRNRAKILATINNAQAALELRDGLAALAWSYAPTEPGPAPQVSGDVPATTAASVAMAKGLRAHGFRFVGPTTAYALMQAVGMVDDHLAGCIARGGVSAR